jgi:uncharacterized protein (TIGR02001 family)
MRLAIACTLFATMAGPACAQTVEEAEFDLDVTIDAVSDYRFRGVSNSNHRPALQPDLLLTHKSGLYVDLWGSLSANRDDNSELNISLGWSRTIGSLEFDINALYYIYPTNSQENAAEFSATASRRFGAATISATASYAPSQDGLNGADNLYLGLSTKIPLRGGPLSFSAAAGFEDTGYTGGKFDWQAGIGAELGSGFELGVSYADTVGMAGLPEGRAGIVVSLSKSF